jgi:hypothetical protein
MGRTMLREHSQWLKGFRNQLTESGRAPAGAQP